MKYLAISTVLAFALAACAPGDPCDPRDPLGLCFHDDDGGDHQPPRSEPISFVPPFSGAPGLPLEPEPDAPVVTDPAPDDEPQAPPAPPADSEPPTATPPAVTPPSGPPPRIGCNGRGCAPGSGGGNSEGNENSDQDGD